MREIIENEFRKEPEENILSFRGVILLIIILIGIFILVAYLDKHYNSKMYEKYNNLSYKGYNNLSYGNYNSINECKELCKNLKGVNNNEYNR